MVTFLEEFFSYSGGTAWDSHPFSFFICFYSIITKFLYFVTISSLRTILNNRLEKNKKNICCNKITDKIFHDIRHTYATRLFELGEPAKTAQELLGHSNINIKLGTYTHVLEQQKIKTASLIDAVYDTDKKISVLSIG